MTRLLYIEASPRKKRSSSIEVAHHFLNVYRKNYPQNDVQVLDLWETSLPPFNGDVIDAKYSVMHGTSQTEAQRKAWYSVEQVINVFKQADQYLFSLPMWNFSIPYPLKHYFDVIMQPSYLFSFSPSEGYKGLVTGKPAIVIYSRGGTYGPGSGAESLDFQKNYMEEVLKFIGFTNVNSIVIEPTLSTPEMREKTIAQAKEKADELARFK